jgi:hypothetical protein
MANLYHEGKVCDAVLRFLEAHGHTKRDKCCSPETERHNAPIDLACYMDDRLWGFEHTSIQAFEGQIEVDVHFRKFVSPIEKAFLSILPLSEQYVLYVPIDATQTLKGLTKQEKQKIRNAIVDWVSVIAPTLPGSSSFGAPISAHRQVSVAGVPFPMSLGRCRKVADSDDPLWIVPVVADDPSMARRNRIQRAYNEKWEQLAAWKTYYPTARTVLIFENIDGPIQKIVAAAVLDIVKETEDRPDEIYLVMTGRDKLWWVSPLLVGKRSFFELDEPKECAWGIDPKSLISLTGQ